MEKDTAPSLRDLGISQELADELADLFEAYEDISDFPITKQTFPVAIKLLRLIFDSQIRKKMNLMGNNKLPPELKDIQFEIKMDTTGDGFQDIIISFKNLGFSIRVELIEKPEPIFNGDKGAIANLIFTVPLVETPKNGMSPGEIDQKLNHVLSKDDQELFDFTENLHESTFVLFHGLSTERGFDFSMLTYEFIATITKMRELAMTLSDRLSSANPESLFFYTI